MASHGASGQRIVLPVASSAGVDYLFRKSEPELYAPGDMKLVAIDLAFFLGVKF